MNNTELIKALDRDARCLREDYLDREILLEMIKRGDVDGFRDKIYTMDSCQRDLIYGLVQRLSSDWTEALGEL